jgi:hypothetical protein
LTNGKSLAACDGVNHCSIGFVGVSCVSMFPRLYLGFAYVQ